MNKNIAKMNLVWVGLISSLATTANFGILYADNSVIPGVKKTQNVDSIEEILSSISEMEDSLDASYENVANEEGKEKVIFTPPFLRKKTAEASVAESPTPSAGANSEIAYQEEVADTEEGASNGFTPPFLPPKEEAQVVAQSSEAFTPPFLPKREVAPSGFSQSPSSIGQDLEEVGCGDVCCKNCIAPNCNTCSPDKAKEPTCAEDEQVLIPNVRAIYIVGSEKAVKYADKMPLQSEDREEGSEVDEEEEYPIQFVDIDVPGKQHNLRDTLSNYLDKPLRSCDLIAIKREIILYYRDANHPLVTVQVPEQDVTDGIVRFLVTESTLDEVTVRGNRYFSKERYENAIKMRKGEPINENVLLNNMNYINRNPFRRADLVYTPGSKSDTTSLDLIVNDRFPLNGYVGVDNTGLQHIDRTRLFAGFTWGDAFMVDQILTMQYTAAPDPHKFDSIMGSWTIPLPIQHFLNFFGGYSRVNGKVPFSSKTKGRGGQASMRYTVPLPPAPYILQEFVWGFDFKRSNNTIEFVEQIPRIGQEVNLTQFMVSYNLGYERCRHKVGFDVQMYFSPFAWLPQQSNERFNTLNPHAKHTYVYGRSSLNYRILLPKEFYWTFLLSGQLTSQTLLPSEQIALGGFSTVRGYEERQLNRDDGILFRTEVLSPKLSVFLPCHKHKVNDKVQFLAFLDYGFGHDRHGIEGEKKNDYVLGVGPGVRYNIGHYLQARLDWGVKVHKNGFPGGWSMAHFSVIASY